MKRSTDDELTPDDTAELDRYRDWFGAINTPAQTRPSWFNADTWTLRPVPPPPLEGRARYDYAGRHRSPELRRPWWARLASWWRAASQPVALEGEHPDES